MRLGGVDFVPECLLRAVGQRARVVWARAMCLAPARQAHVWTAAVVVHAHAAACNKAIICRPQ